MAPRMLWAAGTLILAAGMVLRPESVYRGASMGLALWWQVVLPSLLPFFIVSEILLAVGFVHFLGLLLEPVMRPVFRLPGAASFGLAIGYTSGYPIGAMIGARLRQEGLCTREEAEHLVAFTNNASPLFLLVAVAVGFFGQPALGPLLAAAHYGANLTLGLAWGWVRALCGSPPGSHAARPAAVPVPPAPPGLLAAAVRRALDAQLIIGGFMALCGVVIQLLTALGALDLLQGALGLLFLPLGVDRALLPALGAGLLELSIGTRLVTQAPAPLDQQLAAAAFITGWGGLSVHLQAAAFLQPAGLRLWPFALARLLHGYLAAFYV
ncbi:MAG: sporulation integral membrane protein YlbJ, partial [Firmicutes bacterium]|nr:sporulation integral membrane protein YlbJ [Bacillota bacterium]